MKVLVIGSTGMLGHIMCHVLDAKHEVYGVSSKDGDLSEKRNIDALAETLIRYDAVINCCGMLRQRLPKKPSCNEMLRTFMLNSYLPQRLADKCNLIHISTDCVFSGRNGPYLESDLPDAQDIYGRTKMIGDPEDCLVLRTSIIGPERERKLGLYEWFMAESEVNGFTKHYWNGMTTKQLSLCVLQALNKMLHKEQMLRHVWSNTVSKYELLELFNKHRTEKAIIHPVETEEVNRCLGTQYEKIFDVPPLDQQIQEMMD
jgi:dTDP-4-dehydrorhamnose reductase